jgi:CRISPR/Cas system-associated exonuclease Cas4 (RecB family)
MVVVGASRGAADDLVRQVAATLPATLGIDRLSLSQLAARAAVVRLASAGAAPTTRLGVDAVAARVVFEAQGALDYFAPVCATPGFPKALARTFHELRQAGIGAASLASLPLIGGDLRQLVQRFEHRLEGAGAADRARLFEVAAEGLKRHCVADSVLLLDLPLEDACDRELVAALVSGAGSVLATVPRGDTASAAALETMGGVLESHEDEGPTALGRLRRDLFRSEVSTAEAALDDTVRLFSAPGEGRECVEIARRILAEARRGVAFDDIAVFVRAPQSYFGLLEDALRRAGVPAWFERGTRRPHPTGRAFLALLACASERLSATRFAEYLSLGQVPGASSLDADVSDVAAAHDELFGRSPDRARDELESEFAAAAADAAEPSPSQATVAGTVRAPWRWERLLVQSAVIGRDAERWRRRLDGYAVALDAQITEALRQDGEEAPRVRGLALAREELDHLRAFALPIVETLGSWPSEAPWGDWLPLFEDLAPRVLRAPGRVLRVLGDLRPMSVVGPVDLDEVRRVLGDRLLTLDSEPPSRRFGRVFVGVPQQARGRAFRVVFVPGLAERMFPQKPREDPLLLDAARAMLEKSLPRQHDRLVQERHLLRLAVAAAVDRVYVSYPRIELTESRARVPSFYALDVMRAATGRVPDHEQLETDAREAGRATLAWPAPPDPVDAIDDQEHDLAILRRLMDQQPGMVRGHAHYLLRLNDALRRSVVARWARGDRRWSSSDGLIRVVPATREALEARRLRTQTYSLSALQKFATCPYQFLLSAIYRLQPLEQVEPLQRLDALLRGSIFHEAQARFFAALREAGALPVTSATLSEAHAVLAKTLEEVAQERHEQLAPAVERVWADEIASLGRDLHGWIETIAADGGEWSPKFFEFGFGRVPGQRDPASIAQDVILDGGYKLRGAVDLIEEHRSTRVLRVTDHKTGKRPDRIDNVIIGGGSVLQPVVYGMAVEQALGQPVQISRLSYCTSAGRFSTHAVPISDRTRGLALEALAIVDRAIESGFLPAAPTVDACERCDFRPVCGPHEYRRIERKPPEHVRDLVVLRSLP